MKNLVRILAFGALMSSPLAQEAADSTVVLQSRERNYKLIDWKDSSRATLQLGFAEKDTSSGWTQPYEYVFHFRGDSLEMLAKYRQGKDLCPEYIVEFVDTVIKYGNYTSGEQKLATDIEYKEIKHEAEFLLKKLREN
ncbi:hypothetical protein KY345_01155 [Candidatus Woesearchaeota archaeon]|nr:hypothetical protein [Candidatus Woesearchaeota archaeon]